MHGDVEMSIAEKWERRMEMKGIPAWQKYAQNPNTDAWAEGMGRAFETTVGPTAKALYEEGVKSVKAEDYARAVRGKGEKLVRKVREGLAK